MLSSSLFSSSVSWKKRGFFSPGFVPGFAAPSQSHPFTMRYSLCIHVFRTMNCALRTSSKVHTGGNTQCIESNNKYVDMVFTSASTIPPYFHMHRVSRALSNNPPPPPNSFPGSSTSLCASAIVAVPVSVPRCSTTQMLSRFPALTGLTCAECESQGQVFRCCRWLGDGIARVESATTVGRGFGSARWLQLMELQIGVTD